MSKKALPDLSGFVNASGQQIYASENSPSFRALPRSRDEPPKTHKGWLTEGHPPGAVEAAKDLADSEVSAWNGLSESAKADKIKSGARQPQPWAEESWLKQTKRTRLRKPFSIPEAAQQCAELARKAGWTHVIVTELKKG